MSNSHKKWVKRFGSCREDGHAHAAEHSHWSRREFLRNTGLFAAGTGLLLNKLPINPFLPNPLLANLALSDCNDRVLVLIRLEGGNDGLNTVIPKSNPTYFNIRPNIATPLNQQWALSNDFGMSNQMIDLQPMWNDGKMKVIHNVGYPDQNYSHFRSGDIWASASAADQEWSTGWIGRSLEQEFPSFMEAPPTVPPALQIGVETNLIFKASQGSMALAISNPAEFYQIASTGQLYDNTPASPNPNDIELAYVRTVANSAYRYSESIRKAYNKAINQFSYPDNYLAEQLSIVARLIKGGLGTRIYMVTIGGFDTHSDQLDNHPTILNYLASSVAAFYNDLAATGQDSKVLSMTFSEFSRTIQENGSKGTDHGTGGPIMLFGNGIGNGFIGTTPDLESVGQYGDPLFSTDFRHVYGTVLNQWLCADPTVVSHVLGNDFPIISGLVPTGQAPVGINEQQVILGHNPDPQAGGKFQIKYSLLHAGSLRLRIMSTSGQPLRTLLSEYKDPGSYIFSFDPLAWYLSPGKYYYQLDTGGKSYSRPIEW